MARDEAGSVEFAPRVRMLIAVLILVSTWTLSSRFIDPVGDSYSHFMWPGGADFYYPYNGARALLRGVDPYHHDDPELIDPWGRDEPVDGVMFRQFYPPSHLILDLPLAVVAGSDPRMAARLFTLGSLVAVAGLACVIVGLARRAGALPGGDLPKLLGGLLTLVLAASPGVMLALERGQSDILLALCLWGGAWLLLRGRAGVGMFLMCVPVVCKGYALLATGGVLALALRDRRTRRGALIGGAVAAAVFVLPILHLLPSGVQATRFRSNMFWPRSFNHSFKNLAHMVDPSLADAGRVALALVGLLATGLCFAAAWRATRPGSESGPERDAASTTWIALFMTCGLATMLGWSSLSCSYNLAYVLPGALLLGLAGERLAQEAGRAPGQVSALLIAALACLSLPRMTGPNVPIASIGLVLLTVLGLLCGAGSRPTPGVVAHA